MSRTSEFSGLLSAEIILEWREIEAIVYGEQLRKITLTANEK